MGFDISLSSEEIESMKMKECSCGHFHFEASNWRMHLSEDALFKLFDQLETALDFIEKRRSRDRPSWFRGVFTQSPKHT